MATLKGLRLSFLEQYRTKGDVFPNLLARSTYMNKYCRGGEDWTSTVLRCVEGNCELDPNVTEEEKEKLFHVIWTMQGLPPGRGLWTGGVPGIPAAARYNCFSGDTRFWASGELKALRDLVGRRVDVRCLDGEERPADVRSFGVQKLLRFTFAPPSARSTFRMSVVATRNHRWVTSNRGEVTDLQIGDKVLVTPRQADNQSEAFLAGFLHGIVYGDGTKVVARPKHYQVRLCGKKASLLPLFFNNEMYLGHSSPPSYNGDPHVRIKTNVELKEVPTAAETLDYQAGFLAGWLATDGFSIKGKAMGLEVTDPAGIAWIKERAPLLGFCITGDHRISSVETNFGKRSGQPERLTLVQKPVEYVVKAIEDEGREEEVFCVTEPETGTFTLEGGLPTGNCHYATLRDVMDWCWVTDQLMLGGGVGVGLSESDQLQPVMLGDCSLTFVCGPSHPDRAEVIEASYPAATRQPHAVVYERLSPGIIDYTVEDSREGWVKALEHVLMGAVYGDSVVLDVSHVRSRGSLIKTFGGIASGPGPLVAMLRSVWETIRAAAGRKLSPVECLDVTNFIGKCIKSGNVRRSALIVLGDPRDQDFRDAKKDFSKVASHRHTSNNSLVFRKWIEFEGFDWDKLVTDNIHFGEPGILNLALGRMTDPGAMGVNPCGEQLLHDFEACNLAEVFPALLDGHVAVEDVFKLMTRYCLRQRLSPLTDPRAEATRTKNMRIGVGLGGICDFDAKPVQLNRWFQVVRGEANHYADELKVARPLTVTTVKPSGTVSLLNGSSPGLHAPFDAFYLRRTRIDRDNEMAKALLEAGVPHEPCSYDSSGRTLAFMFPMKARHTRVTVQKETIEDQLARQYMVQENWADNAVSSTITFDKDKAHDLARALEVYAPKLKSTSCLPREHGYAQPPYETISEERYLEMASRIQHDAPLVTGDDIAMDDCAGGSCPVR